MHPVRTSTPYASSTSGVMLLLIAAMYLAQVFVLYGHTGRDDAFLTYWPALTLAEHGDILNYNGDRLEQSSTLLHTLSLAILHKILPVIAMPTLAWGVSIAAGLLSLLLAASALQKQQTHSSGLLVLASAPSFLFWASSGMETLTATLLFTATVFIFQQRDITRKQLLWLAGTAALAVMTRPEVFLVLLAFVIGNAVLQFLTGNRDKAQNALGITLFTSTLAAIVVVSLWRHFYFGAWFPQPVFAKSLPLNGQTLLKGYAYLLSGGQSLTTLVLCAGGLLALLLALCLRRHPHRSAIITAATLAFAQMAFVFTAGGDWMEAGRFLVPVLPALLIAIALLLSPWRWLHALLITALFAVSLYDSFKFVQTTSSGFPLWERQQKRDAYLPVQTFNIPYSNTELQTKDALRDVPQLEALAATIGKMSGMTDRIQIASIQMGFIPYHLSETYPGILHFLDLRALATSDLTRCPVTAAIAHSDTGLKLTYNDFFALLPQLQARCGIAKPDIIYDMGYAGRKDVLLQNGYRFIYKEVRLVKGDFSQRSIGSDLFIAVRQELVEKYGLHDEDMIAASTMTSNKPNIVLMIADDISYDEFGFMGNRAAHTPTLDQLAQQGTVFTSAYVPSAFCRPSLATLLTGQWPHQNRIHANDGVIALPPGYVTLATRMQQQGYATFAGGKFWEDEPSLRGFDEFDGDRNHFARVDQNQLWHFMDAYSNKKPMFIWWAPMLPHTPHNPPQKFLDAIDPATIVVPTEIPDAEKQEYVNREHNFLAMTLWLDDEAGKLRQQLQDRNQLDNTLFVFMADNGFSHKSYSKSFPRELGLRTPMIFSWPGHIPAGRRDDTVLNTVDLYPTLLDFAGASALPPASPRHPGTNLRAAVENREPAVTEKAFGADYQAVTIKTDPEPRPERDIFALHVRDGDWKYVLFLHDLQESENADLTIKSGMSAFPVRHAGDEEMFYLPADPYEQKNLADVQENSERVKAYRAQVLHWWYSTGGKPFDVIKNCPKDPAALCKKLSAAGN
ncbi:MAG TPA: sulfatase-like hydrolase/transferase [Pseudomonadales bacterium]|nr:sulfatase-like hydrolase/transferase [Pseudomonadales bacterium]